MAIAKKATMKAGASSASALYIKHKRQGRIERSEMHRPNPEAVLCRPQAATAIWGEPILLRPCPSFPDRLVGELLVNGRNSRAAGTRIGKCNRRILTVRDGILVPRAFYDQAAAMGRRPRLFDIGRFLGAPVPRTGRRAEEGGSPRRLRRGRARASPLRREKTDNRPERRRKMQRSARKAGSCTKGVVG
jgi:hypothetical protein